MMKNYSVVFVEITGAGEIEDFKEWLLKQQITPMFDPVQKFRGYAILPSLYRAFFHEQHHEQITGYGTIEPQEISK